MSKKELKQAAERRAVLCRVAWIEKNMDAVLMAEILGYSEQRLINAWIFAGCRVWDFCRFLDATDEQRLLEYLWNFENLKIK